MRSLVAPFAWNRERAGVELIRSMQSSTPEFHLGPDESGGSVPEWCQSRRRAVTTGSNRPNSCLRTSIRAQGGDLSSL